MKNNCMEIGKLEFEYLIKNEFDLMQKNDSLTIEKAIIRIRIYNTIAHNTNLQLAEDYKQYNAIFFEKYIEKSAQILEALPSRGMSYYSKKYNLYIGGIPHKNSQYCILE
jgi:hypothetical protein